MIKEQRIIIKTIIFIDWIIYKEITHLVIKPKKGGNPPKDKRFKKIINIKNFWDLIRYNWLIKYNFKSEKKEIKFKIINE